MIVQKENLKNVLNAMDGQLLVLLLFYKDQIANNKLSPAPNLFHTHPEFVEYRVYSGAEAGTCLYFKRDIHYKL